MSGMELLVIAESGAGVMATPTPGLRKWTELLLELRFDRGERLLQVLHRSLREDRRVSRGLHEAVGDALRVLEDLDEALVHLVVLVLRARREDVDVRLSARIGGVVGRESILEREPRVLDEVVVDDRRGDVRQRGGRERRLERGHLDPGRRQDVVERREGAAAVLQLDEAGRLEDEEA